jgi:hypothetical protein
MVFASIFVALLFGGDAGAGVEDYESSGICGGGIPARQVEATAADPNLLLREFPAGGEPMAWRARVLATAGPLGLRALARGIALANEAQKLSIGRGLARAAAACDGRDGIVTEQIVDLIRRASDIAVTEAFTRYLMNVADPAASRARVPAFAPSARFPWRDSSSRETSNANVPIDGDIWTDHR